VGGEQFLVQSVSSNNLTTVRGYNGTTAEAHTSGDRIVKNPRYTTIQIVDAIERTIQSLGDSCWVEATATVTPDTTATWIDSGLTGTDITGYMDLIGGEQLYGDSSQYYGTYGYPRQGAKHKAVRVNTGVPTGLASSGIGLQFPAGYHDNSNNITMRYRVRVTAAVSGSNYSDLTEGLMTEALVMGVVARLLSQKETPNVSEDKRIGETDVGSFVQTAAWYDLRYRELLTLYRQDLMRTLPPAPDQQYIPGWW
jgi:hypothetical protein